MSRAKSFLHKVFYSVGANLVSLFVSMVATLFIPKFLGDDVGQYGYYQIYLFYAGYASYTHLGWCDGVYLRDGGKNYRDLDKALCSSQFWLLGAAQCLLAVVVFCFGQFGVSDKNYSFICSALAVEMVIYAVRMLLLNYLQTTNRIKEYATVTTVGRSSYGIAILLIILLLTKDYRLFVVGHILSRAVELLMGMWWCKEILLTKPVKVKPALREAWKNISVGIKLTIATVASILITGIVLWGIQHGWDVETYGQVSISVNVSNLLLTFISAVALVLYPTLRQSKVETLTPLYDVVRNALMIMLFGALVLYYPVQTLLALWLPQYSEGLRYMAILFPMCIYSAKMTLLVQTYLNVFRLEKSLMRVNIAAVVVAIITTVISVQILHNLTLAMLGIVVNQMIRCEYAERVLLKHMDKKKECTTIIEALVVAVFIYSNWYIKGLPGVMVYAGAYTAYLFVNRNSLSAFVSMLKRMSD